MMAEILYWLASTVAQSVVALLAFGAFLGLSRKDAMWEAVRADLEDLANHCNGLSTTCFTPDGKATVYKLLANQGKQDLAKTAAEKVGEYRSSRDPDDRLAALAEAAEGWLRFRWPEDLGDPAAAKLKEIRRLGIPAVSAHRIRSRISRWLVALTSSCLVAFVASLLVIVRAHAIEHLALADLILLGIFGVTTAVAAGSAVFLALACFTERAGAA
jgi:hypothetical protein